jgi:hypothetical protein
LKEKQVAVCAGTSIHRSDDPTGYATLANGLGEIQTAFRLVPPVRQNAVGRS